jgi:hypothetical protein
MNTDDALEVAKLAAAVGGQLKTIDQFTSERSSNPANKINIQNFINKVKNPRASIPPADYLTKPPPGFAPPPSEDYIQMVEPDMTIGSKPSNPQPIAPIQPVQSIPNPPVQELQTLKSLGLPVIILMLNNNGYLTIKHTHHVLYKTDGNATAPDSYNGVSFPNFEKVAYAFQFDYKLVDNEESFENLLKDFSSFNDSIFVEIKMPGYQELIPKMAVQINEKGEMFTPSLEYMYPFLPDDIVKNEMDIARNINEY